MSTEPDKNNITPPSSPETTELDKSIVEDSSDTNQEKDSGVNSGTVTPTDSNAETNSTHDDSNDSIEQEQPSKRSAFSNSSDSDDYDDEKEKENFEEQINKQLDNLALSTLQSAVGSYDTSVDQTKKENELLMSNLARASKIENSSKTTATSYKPKHPLDFDEMISACKKCKYLPEPDMRRLCDYVCELLLEEGNVCPVQSPVTICGDIHGQFYDLLELFRTTGEIPDTNYVFLGDFVDRGYYSLETFTYLIVLKARYPNRVTLLRGNHESRQITQVYGFYDECLNKYGNVNVWRSCTKVFDLLTVSALIDNSILCVHGGLSPDVKTLDQIRTIERKQEIPHQGAFCDLVWSDPDDVEAWQTSPRGAGYLFGESQTSEFIQMNNLDLIARAHQLANDGLRWHFNETLVTVWSAPNYCYRCNNLAATLSINADGTRNQKYFQAVPNHQRVIPPKTITPYFL